MKFWVKLAPLERNSRFSTDGGGCPFLREILGQTDRVRAELPIFDLFSLVVP